MSSSTLLQTSKELVAPELVARASSLLGGPQDVLSKAMSNGAVPLLLSGLATKLKEGHVGDLLALLRDADLDTRALQNPESLLSDGGAASGMRQPGERFLGFFFGGGSNR